MDRQAVHFKHLMTCPSSHDLDRLRAIGRRKNDICPPDKLARRVSIGQQDLKLSAVGGVKVKADVGMSQPPSMPQLPSFGNSMSGVEH